MVQDRGPGNQQPATSNQSPQQRALSSKLRRCQDKPRFELSNMGLPSRFAIARAGVLCGLPRSPRQGIGHKASPAGRATGAVMLLVDGAMPMMVSPFSIPLRVVPDLQQLDWGQATWLPQLLWRLASTVVAVS